jgi:hypothetical protein
MAHAYILHNRYNGSDIASIIVPATGSDLSIPGVTLGEHFKKLRLTPLEYVIEHQLWQILGQYRRD